jgi:hypothetical protein
MINLNDSKYNTKKFFTKEDILKYVSEYDIFKVYLGDFKLGETFKSPLRSGDDDPSFNIFYSKRHNCLLFKDFAGKRGDFVRLVQELFGISSYNEALQKVVYDLGIANPNIKQYKRITPIYQDRSSDNTPTQIQIKTRFWTEDDLRYWRDFGISLSTLRYFNVIPIEGYFSFIRYVNTPGLAYAYLEYKDDKLTYKIYRPLESKSKKWRNNNPYGVHQGYRQLPENGELLIITKALKEVMSLYETMSISSIGVQSETCYIKDTVVDEYKKRFKRVLTLFDSDRQGIELASSYKKLYDIKPIFIVESKNFSDLIQLFGKEKAVQILKKLL